MDIRLPLALLLLLIVASLVVWTAGKGRAPRDIARTNNRSPTYRVSLDEVAFFMNYTGYVHAEGAGGEGERFLKAQIERKTLDMVDAAEEYIVLSVFLFDNFYTEVEEEAPRDIVGTIVDAFLQRREECPDIRIAVILDPSHKSYGHRVSPAERKFRENGINVFYSDLISGLKKASFLGTRDGLGHLSRGLDVITFRGWGNLWSGVFGHARIPYEFDHENVTIESAYNVALLKANHRKLLVTDIRGKDMEALITSANPHNASAYHVNSAVSVKGDPARYVYNLLREDMRHSARLGKRYAHWCDDADRHYRREFFDNAFPEVPMQGGTDEAGQDDVGVTIVTENRMSAAVIDMLDRVEPGDEVRIQMFYLSFQPALNAILRASKIVDAPIRILLDPNKDSFNKIRDGTPNRQVARYLLNQAEKGDGKIDIRWYSTHGEQNHAKVMSITNEESGKAELTTGSCNWTGRNLDGVNMEANVLLGGAEHVNRDFNTLFDLFWSNSDGMEYSLDYEVYQEAAEDWKWRRGEKPYYYGTF